MYMRFRIGYNFIPSHMMTFLDSKAMQQVNQVDNFGPFFDNLGVGDSMAMEQVNKFENFGPFFHENLEFTPMHTTYYRQV